MKKNNNAFANYAGSCAVCLLGTDTALAFTGALEWKIAGLICMGIPDDEATIMVERWGNDDDPCVVKVCAECVGKAAAPFPAPALCIPGYPVPNIQQPGYQPVGGAA